MAHRRLVEGHTFEGGVVQFSTGARRTRSRCPTRTRDVLCYVLGGTGRLRADGHQTPLRPGLLVHLPAGTPHDVTATTDPLSLTCCLIRTRPA